MKTYLGVGLAMLAGIALGATGVSVLRAQAKPPGYVIIDITQITNADAFQTEVLTKGPASVTAGGGRFLIRTEKITPTDGSPPARFVVIAFDNLEKALAWDKSAAQQEVNKLRLQTTKSRQFILEGVSN